MKVHRLPKAEYLTRDLGFVPVPVVIHLPKAAREQLIAASKVDRLIRDRVVDRTVRKVMHEFPAYFRDEAIYGL